MIEKKWIPRRNPSAVNENVQPRPGSPEIAVEDHRQMTLNAIDEVQKVLLSESGHRDSVQ
jgi:hypothetical protein